MDPGEALGPCLHHGAEIVAVQRALQFQVGVDCGEFIVGQHVAQPLPVWRAARASGADAGAVQAGSREPQSSLPMRSSIGEAAMSLGLVPGWSCGTAMPIFR